jgi:hypothetical protein
MVVGLWPTRPTGGHRMIINLFIPCYIGDTMTTYKEEGWVIKDGYSSSNHPLELTNEELYEALDEMDEYYEAAIESLKES